MSEKITTLPDCAEMVQDAEGKLYAAIEAAVRGFTAETGLPVESIRWNAVILVDRAGRRIQVEYYGFNGTFISK